MEEWARLQGAGGPVRVRKAATHRHNAEHVDMDVRPVGRRRRQATFEDGAVQVLQAPGSPDLNPSLAQ
ncbi:hypothetical protein GCM10011574_28440 [Microbispora bryophytorum]|uniref:Uncharacterized protein n=1 Tax=Microbispora bryophytorum TaxID=1460882 RepID=A0A8H9GYE6_9ACTN|nr:hypothetical protein GCM10011574_28440 [Microbispora bryophytorum]